MGNRLIYKLLTKKSEEIYARDHDTVKELQADGVKNVSFFMDTSFFLKEAQDNKNIEQEHKKEIQKKNSKGNYKWKIES